MLLYYYNLIYNILLLRNILAHWGASSMKAKQLPANKLIKRSSLGGLGFQNGATRVSSEKKRGKTQEKYSLTAFPTQSSMLQSSSDVTSGGEPRFIPSWMDFDNNGSKPTSDKSEDIVDVSDDEDFTNEQFGHVGSNEYSPLNVKGLTK